MENHILVSVDFEVCGTVQGVWFRTYTKQQATVFGLVGYCRNTRQGTVQGVDYSIQLMKQWHDELHP